ncbi:MAG: hypothetical protein CMI55_02350 [Parcubacteria group bacterium]|nr:hypothetical protein [Parcubacteria group bacterium]
MAKIEFPNESFDLVFSWGVVHHCKDPNKVIDELIGICKPGGTIIMGVYMKTSLSWFHEFIRKRICLPSPAIFKYPFIQFVAILVHTMRVLGRNIQSRDDFHRISSQVEDWFFVPIKHFFTIDEMNNK